MVFPTLALQPLRLSKVLQLLEPLFGCVEGFLQSGKVVLWVQLCLWGVTLCEYPVLSMELRSHEIVLLQPHNNSVK